MERSLTRFIRALRAAGAPVSAAEGIDAARTLALVGYHDRAVMKESLGAVLAKSTEEKELHDDLFERFFAPAAAPPPPPSPAADSSAPSDEQNESDDGAAPERKQPGSGSSDEPQAGDRAPEDGNGGDPDQIAQALMALAQSGDATRMSQAMTRAATAVGVDNIRFASQTAYFVRRMLENLGLAALEARLLAKMSERTAEAQAEVTAMIEARSTLQRNARAHVNQRFELFGRAATENFMNDVAVNRPISALSLRDMERMKILIAKMAKRLAVKHSHRRQVRNRGRIDIRRTLRANAGHDGVPFNVIWKIKRKDRPKIVAICDVSGSVAQYVRFLLLFLYTLHEKVTDLRAFAFSNQLRDVAGYLENMPFEAAMERILLEVGSGSTDYGQALADLQADHWDAIDRRTTILVLGDGRSNNGDPRLDIFQEAAARAKRVVWLCPEPASRWGTGDSCMLEYQPFCSPLAHCSTAADLEQALDDILLAYN